LKEVEKLSWELIMRGRNLKKLLDAINLLAGPCGTTIPELGRRLDIDKRQAYRVIETLQDDFCFVIDKDKANSGDVRYYLNKDQYKRMSDMKVADINLSLSEIIALYFLKGHAKVFQGTEIETEIERAFAKLDLFVPDGTANRLEKIKTLFIPSAKFTKDYSGKEEIIDTLTDAMLQQMTCNIEYHSFYDDKVKSFQIDPLRFFERNGGLYIFVRTTSYGHIRVLAVERINKLTLTVDAFNFPEDFDPDSLLKDAFDLVYDEPVMVKVRFSPDQARYIQERRWAKEQKIHQEKDGSIILEMETSGWWDVKRWIMAYGSEAEVIEPVEMRDQIINETEECLKVYKPL
jgi:predicted DNA-binding transcriptional regulator YafY